MFAFVLMPFDQKFDDIYKLGIKETAEQLGINAERVDEQIFHQENILERIYNQIIAADFIIADMTGRNPNVFYETGYAHAKGKICLLLTSNADDIPFDLKHHRHIIYGSSIQNLRQFLKNELTWIKAQVENKKTIISLVLGKATGNLEKTKYIAEAEVDLYFDLNNKTSATSPEIDSIYFYTGAGWRYSQDGQECPSTSSDVVDFQTRHFIKPPVRRLNGGSWAQVKISGKKTVASAFGGEILKDSYRLSGRSLVRVMTTEGAFDYLIELDVNADYLPF
jgi:nucleoside 2-deoxyribosyltransferase